MKDEVKALQDNETWNLARPPTDREVIPGKWVYKVKLGPKRPSGQIQSALCGERLQTSGRTGLL